MNSYSQTKDNPEDLIILDVFTRRQIRTGRLLDIGAWDPIDKSNSRLLIEQGWSAVLIEPTPTPLRNLAAAYGPRFVRKPGQDIVVVGAAVSLAGGMVEMDLSDDAVSTSVAAVKDLWSVDNKGGYYGKAWFQSITLQDIFNQFGGPYDFINIDAEGLSLSIFMELLKTELFPRVICVEHDDSTEPGNLRAMQDIAGRRGYATISTNGTNIILEHRG